MDVKVPQYPVDVELKTELTNEQLAKLRMYSWEIEAYDVFNQLDVLMDEMDLCKRCGEMVSLICTSDDDIARYCPVCGDEQ